MGLEGHHPRRAGRYMAFDVVAMEVQLYRLVGRPPELDPVALRHPNRPQVGRDLAVADVKGEGPVSPRLRPRKSRTEQPSGRRKRQRPGMAKDGTAGNGGRKPISGDSGVHPTSISKSFALIAEGRGRRYSKIFRCH